MDQAQAATAAAAPPMPMGMAREPPAEELLLVSVDKSPSPSSCIATIPASANGEEQRPSAGPSAAAPERVPAAAAVVDPGEQSAGGHPTLQQSICKPKAVEHPKLKRKNIDLKTLWSRAGKKSKVEQQQQVQDVSPPVQQLQIASAINVEPEIENEASEKSENVEEEDDTEDAVYDVQLLEPDPGLRIPIADYDVNDQDRIRRGFIAKGGFRPKKYAFPQHPAGGMRRFVAKWFTSYNWLEYSKELDAAFCFVCYLFKDNSHAGGDCFVNGGFRNWNHKDSFLKHEGGINSAHNKAQEKYNFFIAPKTTIIESFSSTTKEDKVLYIARLTYSLKCLRFLREVYNSLHMTT